MYLDLRNVAKQQSRPTAELLNLYALEGFLDRLGQSEYVEGLVLKGGVLLAAFDTRRATRDVDLHAEALPNEVNVVERVICEIATIEIDDGLVFATNRSSAEVIREDDEYSGVRVAIPCTLATADVSFHVDVNVGDAVWPVPQVVELPRLLGGALRVRGYAMEMVIAEKLVTAMQRGTVNTRWRDFCDLYLLSETNDLSETTLRLAIGRVAEGRRTSIVPLAQALAGFEEIARGKWSAWVRKQGLRNLLPEEFGIVLECVTSFADPILVDGDRERLWDSADRRWVSES